jgi:pimeloyl-ACP methyl ester carboxylesterase
MMADDTAGLMQALGMKQANVLGISLGGRIALELALRHAPSVKKLLLVSTSARIIRNWRRHFYAEVFDRSKTALSRRRWRT